MTAGAAPPGVVAGAAAVWRGVRFLVGSPRSWPFAIVPGALWLILVGVAASLSISWLSPWVQSSLPEPSSPLADVGVRALGWVAAALGLIVGALAASALAPTLSSPALEKIVTHVEQDLRLPAHGSIGFVQELLVGVRAQAAAFMIIGPLLAALWLLTLLVPVVSVVTWPLKYALVACGLAWNLFDYPLTLRGVRVRQRLALVRTHWRPALGFGLGFAVVFAVPCTAILLLPAAVAGATELVAKLQHPEHFSVPQQQQPA